MGRELGKWDKVQGKDSRGCKMIKMINYMFWAEHVKSLEFGCKRPAVVSEKFCTGVRD